MTKEVKRTRRITLGFSGLTDHMRRILDLRCRDGMTVRQVAVDCHVTEGTIRKTMKTIRQRVDVRNIAQACYRYRCWKDKT